MEKIIQYHSALKVTSELKLVASENAVFDNVAELDILYSCTF